MKDFRALDDPDNPENRNAGNGGDLVKHTAYLALFRCLPQARIRECHAGRGVYRVARDAGRRRRLEALFASDLPLASVQRAILGRLGARPVDWYAGSCLLADELAGDVHEAYEWDPNTRAILRAAAHAGGYDVRVIDERPEARFDGEGYLERRIHLYNERDLIFLDPFGLWRHRKHAFRRARFRRILEARQQSGSSLSLFFTWGQNLRGEAADLEGLPRRILARWGTLDGPPADAQERARLPSDGYRQLRSVLSEPILQLRWHCDLRCAMWLVVPARLETLAATLSGLIDGLHREVIPDAGIELALA